MNKKLHSLIIGFFLFLPCLHAQDSLLAALKNEAVPSGEKQFATFKSTRLINAQTNETTKRRTLEFRITHRFGDFAEHNGTGGFHSFYGLDDPTFDIRIGLDYGITDALMVGISRNKQDENVEGHAKLRVLEQTMNDKIPVSISLYGSDAYSPRTDAEGLFVNDADRYSYVSQVIVARKFSSVLSLEVLGSLVYRNLITDRNDENAIYSLGGAGRWKLTKSFNLIADYFYNFRNSGLHTTYYMPLGAGVEIETGGHVFSLMFTNAQYIIDQEFIPNTTESWLKNGWKFGFNISRAFNFAKKEPSASK